MNVRWDAVVKQDQFWSNAVGAPAAAVPVAPNSTDAGSPVEVEVCLYGLLGVAQGERYFRFELGAGDTLRDVIGELGRRVDPEVLRGIVAEDGEVFRYCRVFVDGMQAESLATPIRRGASPTTVEIILLIAAEGG
ncbi:MAG: hypothetical protein A3I00_00005 [Betaproteobacteria bacterium RIFCSPLOWO2_02_FULL_64_12]|nr:MAG: hypothetical protein A3I00_00005 [Betaproteobacteria bacterium RIFCSPLOWO2_02_FULL_64_12]